MRRRKRWTVRGFGVVEPEGHHFSTKTGPEAAMRMWAWDKIPVEVCEPAALELRRVYWKPVAIQTPILITMNGPRSREPV